MKKLCSIFLMLAVLLSLAGCHSTSRDPLPPFGLILTDDTPYQEQIRAGFEAAADRTGQEILVRYAATIEAQLQAIEELKSKSIRGLAICPAAAEGLKSAMNMPACPVVTIDADTDGADYHITPNDYTLCAQAMLDQLLELTDGTGEFAVITGGIYSGSDPWVSAMEIVIREEKYADLIWAETVYCDADVETAAAQAQQLLNKYPNLEAICSPSTNILLGCCQALEAADTQVRATGMGRPSALREFVGNEKVCPAMFLWDPTQIGACAYETLYASMSPLDDDDSFTGNNGIVYRIQDGYPARKAVIVGPPMRFDEENILQWAEIY